MKIEAFLLYQERAWLRKKKKSSVILKTSFIKAKMNMFQFHFMARGKGMKGV